MNEKQSYDNALRLAMKQIDYSDLGDEFWLPTDHTNTDKLLRYLESQEEYEQCAQLIKHINK